MNLKNYKLLYFVLLIIFLQFGIILINNHNEVKKTKEANITEPNKTIYKSEIVNLKKGYRFEEIDTLSKIPIEIRTRPDCMGFTNNNFFMENNYRDKNLIRKSKELYKYDLISSEFIELVKAKSNTKILSASEINNKIIYTYLDCNSIKENNPFEFYISTYENGKEKVLLKYKFPHDMMVPEFVYVNNALYFFVPELIKEKNKPIEDSALSMNLYKYDGSKLLKIYGVKTPIEEYMPIDDATYIPTTDILFNNSNRMTFREYTKDGRVVKIVEDDKIKDFPLKNKEDSMMGLLKDDLLIYNSKSEEYGFLNIKTKKYQKIGKLGRIYEIKNYNDEYIIFLKEDFKHYYITRDDLTPHEIKEPQIFEKDDQRSWILSDGKNIILQIFDMKSDLAVSYALKNAKD